MNYVIYKQSGKWYLKDTHNDIYGSFDSYYEAKRWYESALLLLHLYTD